MANLNMKFRGKAFWARVYEGQEDDFGGNVHTKITVALDDESWSKFNTSKLMLQPKAVSKDDPTLAITFRRNTEPKLWKNKKTKEVAEFGGGYPKVIDAEGNPFSEAIGNGSVVEVLVNVYDVASQPGKRGHRLEGVKIIEHVPYASMAAEEPESPKKTSVSSLPW